MVKSALQKIGLVFFGIFLGLAIMEVGMRIAGFIFLEFQHKELETNKDTYKILALGDSTTANLLNGQGSYPEELEAILNNKNKGIQFKVINEGVPGADSSNVLPKLRGNLDYYKPNMVIVMIGSNDKGLYVKNQKIFGRVKHFFEDFRVYKLIRRITEGLKYRTGRADASDHKEEDRLIKAIKSNPSNFSLVIELVHFYEDRKRYKELVAIGKSFIDLDPNNHNFYTGLGLSYMKLEMYQEAEEMFKKSIAINKNYPYAYMFLGDAYDRLNRPREAINAYAKYIEKWQKFDERAFFNLANLYMDINYTKDAYEVLKFILTIDPTREEEVYMIGKVYQGINESDDAIMIFGETIQKNPNNAAAFIEMARYYTKNNMPEEADNTLSELAEVFDPKREKEVHAVVEAYQELNRTEDMLRFLNIVLEKNPNNLAAFTELIMHYAKSNMSKESDEMLKKAMEISPNFLSRIYDNLGIIYSNEENKKKANEMFDKASELRKTYYNPSTKDNYRELYRKVNERGIKLAIMQYPTLDIDELKSIFTEDEDIIFIDNEHNFKKALANASFDEYFIDDFGVTFGHATRKGNILIAENVANVILKEII